MNAHLRTPWYFSPAPSLLFALWSTLAVGAADWPQFLGPTRNGVYAGVDLAENWPANGPKTVWQKSVGQGFSGPVVAQKKVILFHRAEDQETVECLDAGTGAPVWKYGYPTAFKDDFGFDEGPRGTPAIADGRVFTLGAEGMLTCLDLAIGKKSWAVDTRRELGTPKGFFGVACSPLVTGESVLVLLGGAKGAAIVAFDVATGKVAWKAVNDEATYSSPVMATIQGRPEALCLTRSQLTALDPTTGKTIAELAFRPPSRNSVTAAVPLVVGDEVFLSASYGTGAVLLKVEPGGPKKIWSGDQMANHYATSVVRDGFIYGLDGRTDPGFGAGPSLRCVEWATGKMRWQKEGFGAATVILAGSDLLLLTERGELVRVAATPSGFKERARTQVLPSQTRAHPALADGFLYARSKDKLVCVDLGKR